jgi:hypothetical protein
MSKQVAGMLEDERYFMSASALSDYEAGDTVPGHFQKAASLCLLYAVPFRALLEAVGLSDQRAGKESIPDRFIPTFSPAQSPMASAEIQAHRGILGELLGRSEAIPLFLKGAIPTISGLSSPSLRSIFWVGGVRAPLHPYLANALLVSVDRHKKRAIDSRSRPSWEQLLYVVLKRDGNYLIGPCGQENGALVMHPDPAHLNLTEDFRNRRDAEIVGQVCAVVRKL